MITFSETKRPPRCIAADKTGMVQPIFAFNRKGRIDVFLFEDASALGKLVVDESDYIPLRDWSNASILYHVAQQLCLTPGESEANDKEIMDHLHHALSDNITNKEAVVTEICSAWNRIAKHRISNMVNVKKPEVKTQLEYQGAYQLTLHNYFALFLSNISRDTIVPSYYLQVAELIKSILEGRAFSKNPYLQREVLTSMGEACVKDIPTFKKAYDSIREKIEPNKDEWFTDILGLVEFEVQDLLDNLTGKNISSETKQVLDENISNEMKKVFSAFLKRREIPKLSDNLAEYLAETIPLVASPLTHAIAKKYNLTAEQIYLAIEYAIEKNIRQNGFLLKTATDNPYDIVRLAGSNAVIDKTQLLSILHDGSQPLSPAHLNAIISKSQDTCIQETAKDLLNPENKNANKSSKTKIASKDNKPKTPPQFIIHKGPFTSYMVFHDIEEFVKKVKKATDEMEIDPKSKQFYKNIWFETSELPADFFKQYDTNHSANLVERLLQYDALIDVKAPDWFFSKEQRDRLEAHMKLQREAKAKEDKAINEQNQRKINFKKDTQARFVFWGRLSAALAFLATFCVMIGISGLSVPVLTASLVVKALLYSTVVSLFCWGVLSSLFMMRDHYLMQARDTYKMTNLDDIRNPVEIEALKIGVNATNNWNYARTVFQSSTYTKYHAFLGGYCAAMEKDEKMVAKIKGLKAH